MKRLCQVKGCDRQAIWAVGAKGEAGKFLTCAVHYGDTLQAFKKQTGVEPKAQIIL